MNKKEKRKMRKYVGERKRGRKKREDDRTHLKP